MHQKVFPDSYADDFVKDIYAYTQNSELKERLKEQKDYGVFVIQKILDKMTPYIREHKEDIYGYLTTKQRIDWLGKDPENAREKADQLQSELIEILGDMDQYNAWDQGVFNLKKVLDLTLNLMRECLADIICVMTPFQNQAAM